MVKVLHCNKSMGGGAGIAAHRLHTALNNSGFCESLFGVRDNDTCAPNILKLTSPMEDFLIRLSNLPLRVLKKTDIFFSYYMLPNGVAKAIKDFQPDIIHLHWISNFLSPWTLRQLASYNIPIVWTLHDTWAFTGGCHYYGTCEKWKTHCQQCHILHAPFGIDISRHHWKSKQINYAKAQPTIVGLSSYFKKDIGQSSLLKDYPCIHLPNTIDTHVFQPIERNKARKALGITEDCIYILFGAMNANTDVRKGYDLLSEALRNLAEITSLQVHCLIFGASEGEEMPLPTTFLGRIDDEKTLALAYAAADVFVCPSREENLPNTIMEALACGTPVVAFNIGGIPDMVSHKENGYLADPYDIKDLANGIFYVLEDTSRCATMSHAAHNTAEQRYSYSAVAKQYIALYEKLLAEKQGCM